MKHEVFLPLGVEPLRAALADPTTVTRSVPGFQQDAGDAPGTGRLKLRAGGTTITYRGALRIGDAPEDPGGPGSVTLRAEGTEARGTGTADVTVTVTLTPTGEGTTAVFTVTGSGDGRAAELTAEALESAGVRLLNRFAEALTTELGADVDAADADADADAYDGDDLSADPGTDAPPATPDPEFVDVEPGTWADGDGTGEPADAEDEPDAGTEEDTDGVDEAPEDQGIEGVEDIDHVEDIEAVEHIEGIEHVEGVGSAEGLDVAHADAPPVEAAHARRTMIGRSAEEVDHAPPRGRYAPVPAPEATAPGATLRWAAPAAALAVATAIVVGRALRRRR
ncbi:carbon monoxide dehydrogenase [Streptomyces sp. NPDC127068]|uniref:carbon monoxide dehydrogenase n=1 Tax=Streptomyces sp. NPDC127068 TaxID=3347127 RepID=UPI00364A629E